MKAIVYYKYGPPDVLELEEVEKPVPKDDEVLVKIHAAAVNPLDWHNLRGTPFLQRLESGLLKPKKKILGAEIAGHIETVGTNVNKFQPTDEVIGDLYWCGFGAFAEYVSVPSDYLVLKPANVTFKQAAASPQGAITALHGLRDQGLIQSGQKVLINGASGGVGTFAVQIAKSYGAEVTGVCSTRNLDLVCSIGADHVIDYTEEDFTKNGRQYDLIFDAVANHSLPDIERALNSRGACVIVGFSTLGHMLRVRIQGPRMSKKGNKKFGMLIPKENKEDLVSVKELLQTGKVVPVIDKCYTLSEVPEAIRYLEEGHTRGKVIISVE